MCLQTEIRVYGKSWSGHDATTIYNPDRKTIEDMKPITKEKIRQYVNGKDFEEVYDFDAMILIGYDVTEKENIVSVEHHFFHIPWGKEENSNLEF